MTGAPGGPATWPAPATPATPAPPRHPRPPPSPTPTPTPAPAPAPTLHGPGGTGPPPPPPVRRAAPRPGAAMAYNGGAQHHPDYTAEEAVVVDKAKRIHKETTASAQRALKVGPACQPRSG